MKSDLKMRHNNPMRLSKLFFLSIFILFNQVAKAETSWYQVEIVVFERINPVLDGEYWKTADVISRTDVKNLLSREEVGDEQVSFSILPEAKNRLGGTYSAFRNSSHYRPLIHYSWQQPPLERRSAKFVKVEKLDESQSFNNENIIPTDETEPLFIEDLFQQNKIIDGAIRIRSGFYLHVDVDLTYFAEVTEQFRVMEVANNESAISVQERIPVELKSSRKIKLNEIHYFDHPMFGLIIQVSRL